MTKERRGQLLQLLSSLTVASCTCQTKTHEIEHHRSDCKYRMLTEVMRSLDKGAVTCYMDGIDYQHHLGVDTYGIKLYPSVEAAKSHEPCIVTGGCGVVEVEVSFVAWAEKQALVHKEVNNNTDNQGPNAANDNKPESDA